MKNAKGHTPGDDRNQELIRLIDNTVASANKQFEDIESLLLFLKHTPDIKYPEEFMRLHKDMMTFAEKLKEFLTEQKDEFHTSIEQAPKNSRLLQRFGL